MKTLTNYNGTDKKKFNDKYNFVAVFTLSNGALVLMNPSLTFEGCNLNALSTSKKRIGFDNSTFEVKELTSI